MTSRAAFALLLSVSIHGFAQQPKTATRPLQEQINQLQRNQEQMQKDLDEIKALLKAENARVDTPAARQPPSHILENVYGEPFRGSDKARVAIMEFSDFSCSFCARYATQIFPKLDEAYVRTGKVKYFFRDLPMEKEHQDAIFKARLARCAGEQGKFWEMHDRLFAEQKPASDMDLSAVVHSLGLDGSKYAVCMNGDRYTDIIHRSADLAQRKGITGTPAFLIGTLSEDGRLLTADHVFFGAESFEAFKKILDPLLAPDPSGK
jgi:protein-disulfide isomerase